MAKRSGTSTVLKKQPKKRVRYVTKAHLLEQAEGLPAEAVSRRRAGAGGRKARVAK